MFTKGRGYIARFQILVYQGSRSPEGAAVSAGSKTLPGLQSTETGGKTVRSRREVASTSGVGFHTALSLYFGSLLFVFT